MIFVRDSKLLQRDRGQAQTKLSQTGGRSEEHTSELQSPCNLVCRLLLEKKNREQCIEFINSLFIATPISTVNNTHFIEIAVVIDMIKIDTHNIANCVLYSLLHVDNNSFI